MCLFLLKGFSSREECQRCCRGCAERDKAAMSSRLIPTSCGSGRRQRALGKDYVKEGRQKPCKKDSFLLAFLLQGRAGRVVCSFLSSIAIPERCTFGFASLEGPAKFILCLDPSTEESSLSKKKEHLCLVAVGKVGAFLCVTVLRLNAAVLSRSKEKNVPK